MSDKKYTQTSTFLFPLLEIPKQLFRCDVTNSFNKRIMTTRFSNAFMWDEDLEFDFNHEPYIFIVLKPYRDYNFEEFYSTIISMATYVDEYEKDDFIVMVFKIPEKHLDQYNLLLEGKYSKLSPEIKGLILKNSFFKLNPNILPRILSRCPELRKSWEKALSSSENDPVILGDQEVWSIIDKNKEGLSSKMLKQLGVTQKLNPAKEFDN